MIAYLEVCRPVGRDKPDSSQAIKRVLSSLTSNCRLASVFARKTGRAMQVDGRIAALQAGGVEAQGRLVL